MFLVLSSFIFGASSQGSNELKLTDDKTYVFYLDFKYCHKNTPSPKPQENLKVTPIYVELPSTNSILGSDSNFKFRIVNE